MLKSRLLRGLAVAVLLIGFCIAGLSRISFDVQILKLLPTHLPQVQGLAIFLKHFALADELMITLETADADAADAAATSLAEHLRAKPELVRRAVERAPWESGGGPIAELLAFALLNQPPEKVTELTAHLSAETIGAALREAAEKLGESIEPRELAMLSYDPLGLTASLDLARFAAAGGQSEFASADGAFRVIYIQTAGRFSSYRDNITWLNAIKAECARWNAKHGVTLGFTGEPAFVADIAGTMQWDMQSSGMVTLLVIAVIFWLCYRRAWPLLALQGMLVVTFAISLACAGLFLRELTVIGVGFASILIGLTVDYGYLVFQKARGHTGTVRELQRECFQNVSLTAGTTASAFFALNLSSLPGLAQLGNLVGIGVIVGATVMLGIFAPIALRLQRQAARPSVMERFFANPRAIAAGGWATLALVAALLAILAVKGPPSLDSSIDSLRPRVSGAYDALGQVYAKLTDNRDLLSLIVIGGSEDEVLGRLRTAEAKIEAARARGEVRTAAVALPLWPDTANQRANLPALAALAAEKPRLREAILAAGFTEEAFGLADAVLTQWAAWRSASVPIWPENDASRWVLRRVAHRSPGKFVALGMVQPVPGQEDALASALTAEGTFLVSWKQLGRELRRVIPQEFGRLIAALGAIILSVLWIAFRSLRDVLLFAATTTLVFFVLLGAMSLLGLTWNLFNLAAILLLLGTGTDYSILVLLAIRRNGGDTAAMHRALGIVIFLCAFSAAAGFGTITWANHIGLATLGETCALGLAIDALISVFLLPVAWRWLHRRDAAPRGDEKAGEPSGPPAL